MGHWRVRGRRRDRNDLFWGAPGNVSEPARASVSVVAPTYKRRDKLREWTASVLADRDVGELIVVVDGCTDGSFELLEELARDDDRLVPLLVPNAGQFPALQAGAERASGEVLLFLDDDVVPAPGLAAAHASHHNDGALRLVLGYMPVRLPKRRAGAVATFVYARQYEAQCEAYESDPNKILEEFWAGNFSMRREHALAVGLSTAEDRRSYPYHGDRNFGLRCRAAGVVALFDRSLRAEHLHTRPPSAIVTEAEARARGAVTLHRHHHAVLGTWTPEQYGTQLRPALRAIVLCARSRPAAAVLIPMLRLGVFIAGAARLYRMQEALAVLLMNVVEVHTGIRLTRGQKGSAPGGDDGPEGQRWRDAVASIARWAHAVVVSGPLRGLVGWPPIVRLQERIQRGMPATEVHRVLDALDAAGIGVWMTGGWGIDALVGRQLRAHRDLDLAVDSTAGEIDRAVAVLQHLGYVVIDAYSEEGRPDRVILQDPRGHQVDLHPCESETRFDVEHGGAFAVGRVGGRAAPCLSAAAQLHYHEGYPERPIDRFDVDALRRLSL